MIALLACAAPLLDELVVPGDVAALTTVGEEGSALGTRVAVDAGRTLATAPGVGEVCWLGEARTALGAGTLVPWWEPAGAFVGWAERGIYALPSGSSVADLPAARAFAGGPHGRAWATEDEVHADGLRWALSGVRDLAVDDGRVLAVACGGGDCEAWELSAAGAHLLGSAGEGGRVTVSDGAACWSDPQLSDDQGAGRVACDDGREILGEPGDHLGRSLAPGWAAGGLNPHLVPHRARIVPLGEGPVLAVDRSVETRPLALASDGDTLVIGVPGYPLEGPEAGAVHEVDLAALP